MKRSPRLTRRERRAHQRGQVPAKWAAAFSAVHEAAHAVAALAVGADVDGVYLTPKPQAAIITADCDAYQIAALTLAGPTADYILGVVPGRDEPDYREWLLNAQPSKDTQIVMGCGYEALGLEPGPVIGERDGIPLHGGLPQNDRDQHGPELAAWFSALDQVVWQLVTQNGEAIKRVAFALNAKPTGLTGAEVRHIAGPIAKVSRERLHETIDALANQTIDAGSAAATWAQVQRIAREVNAREAVRP